MSGMAADPLDQVILGLSESDPFTIRDACEGVQIFGASGSGKTSGSGQLFAKSYLNAGFGGLVLTAKAEEADLWRSYAQETGRSADLLIFNPSEPHRFNILAYEWEHSAADVGNTRNIVELFLTLAEIASRGTGKSHSENEAYWRNELQKLLINSIELLRLAEEPVTFANILKVVQSAPRKDEQLVDDAWRASAYCAVLNTKVAQRNAAGQLTPADVSDYEITVEYWLTEFPQMDERPRSSVVGNFTGLEHFK